MDIPQPPTQGITPTGISSFEILTPPQSATPEQRITALETQVALLSLRLNRLIAVLPPV